MKPYYAVSKSQLGKANIGVPEQHPLTPDKSTGKDPGPDPDQEANLNLIQNHS